MRRTHVSLTGLTALALVGAAAAQERLDYALKGPDGRWVQLTVEGAGPHRQVTRRVLGATDSWVGTGTFRADRLEATLAPGGAGLVGALRGAAGQAPRSARYRLSGDQISGTFGDAAEAGRLLAEPHAGGRLRIDGQVWRDPAGRQVVLRGANVGLKQAPFLPPHDDAQVERLLRASGANFVRLYVAWRRIEPQPLRYDEGYLDEVVERVRRFTSRGCYVLVDMHQDVWGGPITAHGAPDWASFGARAPKLPLPATAPWQLRYLDPRCLRSFEALWSNRVVPASGVGLADHYARAWARLALRLAGEDRVVGYDLINEPFVGREAARGVASVAIRQLFPALGVGLGSVWRALRERQPLGEVLAEQMMERYRQPERFAALLRGMAGASRSFEVRLEAFYRRVTDAIRAVDPDRPVFLEPMALVGVGVRPSLRLSRIPQAAYAPHLYDAFMDSGQGFDGETGRLRRTMEQHREHARREGVPLVVGEWGNLLEVAARGGDMTGFARAAAELLDVAGCGAAYWEHRPGDEDAPLFREACRPWPERVAGGDLRWGFDPVERRLRLSYQASGPGAPTLIRLPGLWAGGSLQVRVEEGQVVTIAAAEGGSLAVHALAPGRVTLVVSVR